MKTKDFLLNEMLNNLSDDYQKTAGFPIHDILSVVASALEKQSGDIEFSANQNNVLQIFGEHLTQFVYERTGIQRKQGSKAWGYLQITTNQNTIIPAGSVFTTEQGVEFVSVADVQINNTTGSAYVESAEVGTDKNVPAHSIVKQSITIVGVVEVDNEESFTGGSDIENDDELRQRYLLHISKPSSSGNKLDYIEWAMEIDGVQDARIIPLWNGDNTVKVIVIGENNSIPSQSIVDNVQNYINPDADGSGNGVAPIGAYVTCVAVQGKSVNVSTTIQVEEGYSSVEVQADTEQAIRDFISELDLNQQTFSSTQMLKAILNTNGVKDASVPLLNGGSQIVLTDEQIATAGTITVTVGS